MKETPERVGWREALTSDALMLVRACAEASMPTASASADGVAPLPAFLQGFSALPFLSCSPKFL